MTDFDDKNIGIKASKIKILKDICTIFSGVFVLVLFMHFISSKIQSLILDLVVIIAICGLSFAIWKLSLALLCGHMDVTLSPDGILFPFLQPEIIPWKDIEQINYYEDSIVFFVYDRSVFTSVFYRIGCVLNTKMGVDGDNFEINLRFFNETSEEIEDIVYEFHPLP